MAKINGETIIFDSGKEWTPDLYGIVGLSPDLRLYEGFDSRPSVELSPDQRRELADLMIARWQAFKDATDEVA